MTYISAMHKMRRNLEADYLFMHFSSDQGTNTRSEGMLDANGDPDFNKKEVDHEETGNEIARHEIAGAEENNGEPEVGTRNGSRRRSRTKSPSRRRSKSKDRVEKKKRSR